MYTAEVTKRSAIVAWLKPLSRNAGTVYTDIVDMSLIRRLVVDVLVGTMTGAATLTASIVGNTASSTVGGTTITGKTLSAGSFSGSDDSDGIARLEATSEEFAAQGLRYGYAEIITATAAVVFAVLVTAYDTRYGDAPGTIPDLTAVREIIY